MKILAPLARLAACAAAVALITGSAGTARAGYYAYAVQQTTGYSFTGGTVGPSPPHPVQRPPSSATRRSADAHVGQFDAAQSYVGPAAGKPAENTFTPKGQTTPDYVRGDVLVSPGPAPAFGTNNVAEGFLNGPGNAAGSGSWTITAPVTITSAGALTLSFSYTNLINLVNAPVPSAPSGVVSGDFSYTFTIATSTVRAPWPRPGRASTPADPQRTTMATGALREPRQCGVIHIRDQDIGHGQILDHLVTAMISDGADVVESSSAPPADPPGGRRAGLRIGPGCPARRPITGLMSHDASGCPPISPALTSREIHRDRQKLSDPSGRYQKRGDPA